MANPFAIGRTHSSANSAATSMDNILSRSRSVDGNGDESYYAALKNKDIRDVTQITKDDLTYRYSRAEEEQFKKWQEEENERTFGSFAK